MNVLLSSIYNNMDRAFHSLTANGERAGERRRIGGRGNLLSQPLLHCAEGRGQNSSPSPRLMTLSEARAKDFVSPTAAGAVCRAHPLLENAGLWARLHLAAAGTLQLKKLR